VTFPDSERVISGLERWRSRIMLFCVLGTCACFVGLAYLQVRVSGAVGSGRDARVTQCLTRPVTIKKEDWFHASGVTSAAERQLVLNALPSRKECAALLKRK
jgi:hypothetical protein